MTNGAETPRSTRWRGETILFLAAGSFLALAILLVAAAWGIENWRGAHAWQRLVREHNAKNDPIDSPPAFLAPVPDDQNFLATPLLRPFFNYTTGPVSNGEPTIIYGAQDGIDRMNALHLPDGEDSAANQRSGRTGLEHWQSVFAGMDEFPKLAQPGTPAKDVLKALSRWDAELAELESASRRPHCQVPGPIEERMGVWMPCLAHFKSVTSILKVRCAAKLADGDGDGAVSDVEFADRMASQLSSAPVLIDELVSIAIRGISTHMIWEGMARHQWKEAQLVRIEKLLASRDPRADMSRALHGERWFEIKGIEDLGRRQTPANASGNASPSERIQRYFPRGWQRQNEVSLIYFYDRMDDMLALWQADRIPAGKADFDPIEKSLQSRPYLYSFLARMLTPALTKAISRSDRSLAINRMGIIACGLEKYKLAKGEYPASLDALAPQYLAKLPADPCTGKSFYYSPGPDGWYRLYSTGPDGKDDGGIFTAAETGSDWLWPLPTETNKRMF